MFDVLEIMSRRTSLPANSHWAVQLLNEEYNQFEALFRSFFAEIVSFAETEFFVEISRPPVAQSIILEL
jgi:acyl carrier protein phosphodiesterase